MSALLRAGASLTPSPVIATSWPLFCSARNFYLVEWGAAGKYADRIDRRCQLICIHSVEFRAGQGVAGEAEFSRDLRSGVLVVTSDHFHGDACLQAMRNRYFRLLARRVSQSHQSDEGKFADPAG